MNNGSVKGPAYEISVVMAAYNGEKYIAGQIESILGQDFEDFELVIVDDRSTDGTRRILKDFEGRDKRIKTFFSDSNRGAVATFQEGVKLSKGRYVAFSDQDDLWDKDKLSAMREELDRHTNSDMVICDMRLIGSDGGLLSGSMWRSGKINPESGKPLRKLLYSNFVTGAACMFRSGLLKWALPFPPDCYMHDWWLAVAASCGRGGGILVIDRQLQSYRQHESNVIGARDRKLTKILGRFPDYKTRAALTENNLRRINGYATRSEIWSAEDLREIALAKRLFEGYLTDGKTGLMGRIAKLPLRLKYARTRHTVHAIGVFLSTVYPRFAG